MRLFYIILFTLLSTSIFARVIKVGKQEIITSLTKAIAISLEGDTILLHEGNYREGSIRVTKPLFIIG